MAHIFCFRDILNSIFRISVECEPKESKLLALPLFLQLNNYLKLPIIDVSYEDQVFEFAWGNKQRSEYYFIESGGQIMNLKAVYDEDDDKRTFKIVGANNGKRQIFRNKIVTASTAAARISLDDEDFAIVGKNEGETNSKCSYITSTESEVERADIDEFQIEPKDNSIGIISVTKFALINDFSVIPKNEFISIEEVDCNLSAICVTGIYDGLETS